MSEILAFVINQTKGANVDIIKLVILFGGDEKIDN